MIYPIFFWILHLNYFPQESYLINLQFFIDTQVLLSSFFNHYSNNLYSNLFVLLQSNFLTNFIKNKAILLVYSIFLTFQQNEIFRFSFSSQRFNLYHLLIFKFLVNYFRNLKYQLKNLFLFLLFSSHLYFQLIWILEKYWATIDILVHLKNTCT